jgi:metal-sulfur cluster biosynthetic enzyme
MAVCPGSTFLVRVIVRICFLATEGGAIMVTEEQAREALKQVEDPELGLNIVDLGLVYEVEVEGGTINVRMTLTSPGCPVGPQILNGSKMVLQDLEGVEEVNVELVWEPFWSPDRINPDYRAILGL